MLRDKFEMAPIKLATYAAICLTPMVFAVSASQAADVDAMDALKACARIEDANTRNTCYDDLGKQALAEETESAEPSPVAAEVVTETAVVAEVAAETAAETAVVAEAAATSPAEKAAENPVLLATEDDKKKPIFGHVRKCQEASDRRWFFILESGEVWKQSGGKTRRFSDCDFDVVIRKDIFGYKMTIDGDEDTVRVRRHN